MRMNPYSADKIGAFLILIGQCAILSIRLGFIRWIKLSTLRTTGLYACGELMSSDDH